MFINEEWRILAERKETVDLGKTKLNIHAGIECNKGDSAPHFFLTADEVNIGENVVNYGFLHDTEFHDKILKHRPEYKLIADLHLSDDNGTPMHAVDNGWFYLGKVIIQENEGIERYKRNNEALAKHLRIDVSEAELLEFETKQEFSDYVDTLKHGWKLQAKEAVEFLGGYK